MIYKQESPNQLYFTKGVPGYASVKKLFPATFGEGFSELYKVRSLVFFLSAFFLVTLGVLFYHSLLDTLKLRKEISGANIIRDLSLSIKTLQDLRGFEQMQFYGDTAFEKEIAGLKKTFAAQVEAILQKHPDDLFQTHQKLRRLSDEIVSRRNANLSGMELFYRSSGDVENLFSMIYDIHHTSGLVLDSQYSSYYLERVGVLFLIRITENLGRVRGMTSGYIQQRKKNHRYREKVEGEIALLKENIRRLNEALVYLFLEEEYKTCPCRLQFEKFFGMMESYVAFTRDILQQPAFSKSPGGYFRDATEIMEEAMVLQKQMMTELETVLNRRLLREASLVTLSFLVSLLILGFFLWLFRFYFFSNLKLIRINKGITEGRRILLHSGSSGSAEDYQEAVKEVYQSLCENLARHAGYILVWVGLKVNDEAKSVEKAAFGGDASGYLQKIQVSWGDNSLGDGPVGRAIKTGENQIYNNIDSNPGFAPWRKLAISYGMKSVASIPLVRKNEVIGSLVLYSTYDNAFTNQELDLLRELTADVIFNLSVIETRRQRDFALAQLEKHNDSLQEKVAQRTRQIAQVQEATVISLSTLVELRDQETGNHILRTREYIKILLENMGQHEVFQKELTREKMEYIYKSAPLHDIGKVGIPDHILNKPGKLTAEEIAIMETHTLIGAKSIETAARGISEKGFLETAKEIILYHHEKWNGKGYPHRLKEEQIPLAARVMSVADVYDALISKRIYKDAYSHERAVEIMREESGVSFDPRIIEIFLSVKEQFQETACRYADE